MSIQLFPPHPLLDKLIMHILVLELDQCTSHIPATLCPSVMLIIRGGVTAELPDGSLHEVPRFILRGPFNAPIQTFSAAKTLSVSVAVRPGMLYQATGILPAGILCDFLAMEQVADQQRVARLFTEVDTIQAGNTGLNSGVNTSSEISEYVRLFQEFLIDTLDHRKKSGMGASFLAAHQKMFLPLLDLSLYFGIGERQLERRVREAFGLNLRDTRRVVRFGWSLLRIIGMPVGWGDLTGIAQESEYYDQAHMHKEYLELAGISPITLLQKIASNDPAYWLYRLSNSDTRKLFLPV